jgi:ATP-dependent Clp protease ATP-binding subunit ClpC
MERGLRLILTNEARGFIIDKGEVDDGLDYGARPLRRSVERFIEDTLSEELLRGTYEGKNVINVSVTEVGDQKQLKFDGEFEEPTETESAKETEMAGVASGEESNDDQ